MMRISLDNYFERSFWIEKFSLFGFVELSEEIKEGCVDKIQAAVRKYKKELLEFKLWSRLEKMVIKSWIDGELKEYKNG